METCGARGTVKVADFSLTETNNIFKSSTHTHTRTYVDLVVQKTCPHISTCAQSPKFPAPVVTSARSKDRQGFEEQDPDCLIGSPAAQSDRLARKSHTLNQHLLENILEAGKGMPILQPFYRPWMANLPAYRLF